MKVIEICIQLHLFSHHPKYKIKNILQNQRLDSGSPWYYENKLEYLFIKKKQNKMATTATLGKV